MTHRYFVQLAYKGTHYHGWQKQPNATTVQEVLENAFSTVLRRPVTLTGAGRTDTGVHASKFFAHFDMDAPLYDIAYVRFKLNNYLPWDIALQNIFKVHARAHTRYDALVREYQYHLIQEKDPFNRDFAAFHPQPMDFERMNEAAEHLKQYEDFTSFALSGGNASTNLCNIMHAEWCHRNMQWVFTIRANRFLRKMVRAILGTLYEVGRNRMSIEDFCKVIESKDRTKAGQSVAPHGLFLTNIEYPGAIYPNGDL